MQRRSRMVPASLALVLVLFLLPLATPAAASTTGLWRVPGPVTRLYIGQATRLTAQIPAFWTASSRAIYDYVGPDGFVRSVPLAASKLDDACAQTQAIASRSTVSITHWRGEPACIVTAPAEALHRHRAG